MGLILDNRTCDPAGEATSAAALPANSDSKSIEGALSVMYITVRWDADFISRMFSAGEKRGATGPTGSIRRMPW
jgi:hypothetical protein